MGIDDNIDLMVAQIEIMEDKYFMATYPEDQNARIFSMAMIIHEEIFNKILNIEDKHKWLKKN